MTNWQQGKYQPKNAAKYIGKHIPHYRSGWELQFCRMCDDHPSIIAWASESHKIPYIHPITGKRSNYVPDFFVVYMDKQGKKHAEIVEIKPSGQMVGNAKGQYDQAQAVINEAKWNSARQWCKAQGIGFRIVTEKDMFNKPQKNRAQKKAKVAKVAKRKKR
jgi:hypothetical protein|tara:strand:- start:659 stop:1141 length:483 start_codon:yes stop_codon:yes gene_type:complete